MYFENIYPYALTCYGSTHRGSQCQKKQYVAKTAVNHVNTKQPHNDIKQGAAETATAHPNGGGYGQKEGVRVDNG